MKARWFFAAVVMAMVGACGWGFALGYSTHETIRAVTGAGMYTALGWWARAIA